MMKTLVVGAFVLGLAGFGALPAVAAPAPATTVQQQIDDVMVRYPGGVQVSETTVSWEDGAILLTLASPTGRAIGSCATGSYCAFSATNYGGTRLAFTGCSATTTSNSLSALGGTVRSVANARTSGTVRAMNGTVIVHALSANTGITSNASSVTALSCTT